MAQPTRGLGIALAALLVAVAFRTDSASQPPAPILASGCPAALGPDVLLCDDFESGTFESLWDIGSNSGTWPNAQFVRCEDGFGYRDRCAAWSNYLIFDTYWGFWGYDAWRAFPPQQEFYVRWYQYISDPYAWGPLEDKSVMLHDVLGSITAYVATNRNHLPVEPNSGPGMPFVANYQDLDWAETGGAHTLVNRFQNQGHNIALEPGRWYLFEWYLKLNTPGLSNGVTRLWIDDATGPIASQTLRLYYKDMRWLRTGDAAKQFEFLRLTVYDQRCDFEPNTCPPDGPAVLMQSHRWDRILVSRKPVGPIPSAPACEGAQAIPSVLWPPDGRMVPVFITGVTHPQQEPLSIEIVKVDQSRPGRTSGARDRRPDSIILGDHVFLRAELAEFGRGRRYEIQFVARDQHGGECTGAVTVSVPDPIAHGLRGRSGLANDSQSSRR